MERTKACRCTAEVENTLLNELRLLHIALKRCISRFGDGDALTAMGAMVLHFLSDRGGGAPQKDVENEFHLRRSTASELIRKLEQDGYVERQNSDGDARCKFLHMTEKARAVHAERQHEFETLENRLRGALSLEERQTFLSLAARLRRCMATDV